MKDSKNYLLREIPSNDLKIFKRACMIEGTTMKQKLLQFIEGYGNQYKSLINKIEEKKGAKE